MSQDKEQEPYAGAGGLMQEKKSRRKARRKRQEGEPGAGTTSKENKTDAGARSRRPEKRARMEE